MELYLTKCKEAKVGEFYKCDNIYNCDVEAYDACTDDIIFCLKKKVIDDKYYNFDNKLVKLSKMESVNRGNAAGKVTLKGLTRGKENWKAYPVELTDKEGNPVSGDKSSSSSFFKYNDGRISKRARSNSVSSFALGGFDKSPHHPCRLTHYTKKHIEEYKTIFPLCKELSDKYFEYFPDKWLSQNEVYTACPDEFLIPDTNFSTITLNHDFRTACHLDKGDCKKGLTCFTIKKCGEFSGGELIFPEYDIAVNIEQGDLLIFNPHEAHCNNELTGEGRMSMVFYLREKMHLCQS
tara:strand:- start:72 stop:950 length:879 start_codon:yes stop_codon:yes gene_type:complete